MIEQAIYARLSGFTALTDLVGTRISHAVIPQTEAYPQVAFTRISTRRYPAMNANATVATSRVQVNVYGTTAKEAQTVAKQVRAALSRYRGTSGGVVVQAILDEAEHTDYDADIQKHRVILEFMASFEE